MASAAVAALLATLINLSLIVTTFELMNVVLPFTVKLPCIRASAVSVRLAPSMLPTADILPLVVLPLTLTELSVPTLVIFGCAFVVTVPAVVAEPELTA